MKKHFIEFIYLVIALTSLTCTAVNAATINLYTDRGAWLADASAAGLTVATNDFSLEPPNYPDISVGGSDWTLGIRAGIPWDSVNERLGFSSGGGRTMSLDYVGGVAKVFGFGIDLGPTTGLLQSSDIEGDSRAGGGGAQTDHFLGLLGLAVLDPVNAVLGGALEINTSGLAGNVHFDNLSVATAQVSAVPIPAAVWLFGTALIGVLGVGKRRLLAPS